MKKNLSLLLSLIIALPLGARDRIYVSTDRSAYLSGDLVYCSLFCTNENGQSEDFSATAYLELISTDGTAAEAKIGLFSGRGAGSFRIPEGTPTGNYRLVAYTARSEASEEGSRILSVFNTGSNARVKDGVTVVEPSAYKAPRLPEDTSKGLSLSFPGRLSQGRGATLLLDAPKGADISLSIYHEDALSPAETRSLDAFLHGQPALAGRRSGEYEGEVILANVEGLPEEKLHLDGEVTAFLSSAGSPTDVYIGRSDNNGHIRFFTDNIYGNRELVCEVVSMSGQQCHIALSSPFTHPEPGDVPPLVLSGTQRSALVARKAALQDPPLQDTLLRFIPRRKDLLLAGAPTLRYHLDDYNRFPTVREICVEFVSELQFVRRDGRYRIRMMVNDGTSSRKYLQDNILVLMDGVVLTDHGMLADFDAMLLEDIDMYRQGITLGGVTYNGVVNFITKKNYVTALHFPDNVRVIDFLGVSYPVSYPGGVPQGTDRRQLLYWHPALEIPAGTQQRIQVHTPAYSGTFRIVAEGLDASGKPVSASYTFTVE